MPSKEDGERDVVRLLVGKESQRPNETFGIESWHDHLLDIECVKECPHFDSPKVAVRHEVCEWYVQLSFRQRIKGKNSMMKDPTAEFSFSNTLLPENIGRP